MLWAICNKMYFFFLLGLTCTEQNFITKAGFQQAAAEHGLIVVAPDTSPRKFSQMIGQEIVQPF